jgi:hypothetical protein
MLHFKIDHERRGAGECTTAGAYVVACPNCHAQLTALRSSVPVIDACGFESLSLVCEQCGAALAGIVDPADDALLLTIVEG